MLHARKVIIFGGSFSPPTLAHEAIIAKCLTLAEFDAVWVLPSGDRPDKTIAMQDEDRLHMLQLVRETVFAGDERLVISDFELKLPRPSQTYRTARALALAFPDYEFWFAFGRDAYVTMPHWPHGEILQKTLRMVVFGDASVDLPAHKDFRYVALDPEFSNMSSTLVRQALARGESVHGLVSVPVAQYLGRFTSGSSSRPTTE